MSFVFEGVKSGVSHERDIPVVIGEIVSANDSYICSGTNHRRIANLHSKHRDCANDSLSCSGTDHQCNNDFRSKHQDCADDSLSCNKSYSVTDLCSSNIVQQSSFMELGEIAGTTVKNHNHGHSVARNSTTDQATNHGNLDNSETVAVTATTTTTNIAAGPRKQSALALSLIHI